MRVKLDYEMKRELYERLVRASEDKTKDPETVKEQAAQRYHLKVVDEQIPIADEWVTQMLRQGDAQVFKKYSQIKREALEKIIARPARCRRRARLDCVQPCCNSPFVHSSCTVRV